MELEDLSPLLEDELEDDATLTTLGFPLCSSPSLTLTVEVCLFGGGDIDLFVDDWKAS